MKGMRDNRSDREGCKEGKKESGTNTKRKNIISITAIIIILLLSFLFLSSTYKKLSS